MLSSSPNTMDTELNKSNAANLSEDQIDSFSDNFCNHSDYHSESTPRREPSGKLPGRSRSFDRRGAALLADMLQSAMTVAAQVSPESTLKGGGKGIAHDRSSSVRGTSPSPRKRCRSVCNSNEVVPVEAEDQFEEDPDFAPRRLLPSLKSLINSDNAKDVLQQR